MLYQNMKFWIPGWYTDLFWSLKSLSFICTFKSMLCNNAQNTVSEEQFQMFWGVNERNLTYTGVCVYYSLFSPVSFLPYWKGKSDP